MQNLSNNDRAILTLIGSVAEEQWFLEGEDCPNPELIGLLESSTPENEDLQELVNATVSGPGLTDVLLESMEPIADLLMEGADGEEIYESNQNSFREIRTRLFNNLK